MPKRRRLTAEDSETLLLIVQEHPNLYDPSDPRYKDAVDSANSWNSVAEVMGREDGEWY